jgi:hypothetical protein
MVTGNGLKQGPWDFDCPALIVNYIIWWIALTASDESKPGWLHEKTAVATWNLGTISFS